VTRPRVHYRYGHHSRSCYLPSLDAAYAIWREKVHFERLERQARRLTPLESGKPCSWLSAGAVYHPARIRATR
jgi:hypothetical protein